MTDVDRPPSLRALVWWNALYAAVLLAGGLSVILHPDADWSLALFLFAAFVGVVASPFYANARYLWRRFGHHLTAAGSSAPRTPR